MINNNRIYYLKISYLFIGVLLFSIQLYGQNYGDKNYYLVDSLDINELSENDKQLIVSSLTLFHNTTADSIKVKAIDKIIEESWDNNVWPKYNLWLHGYVKEKIETNSQQLYLQKALAHSTNNIGYFHFENSEMVDALKYYEQSEHMFRELGDKPGSVMVLNNIGATYESQGQINKALEAYYKGLKLSEDVNDKRKTAHILSNIGVLFKVHNDFSNAFEYFKKSLAIRESIDDLKGVAVVSINIATIYRDRKNINKAIEFNNKAIEICKKNSFKRELGEAYINLGFLYNIIGERDKALTYYHKGLKVGEEIGNKVCIVRSLHGISEVYTDVNKFYKAKIFAIKSLIVAKEVGNPFWIKNVSEVLNKLYKKENNWKMAYEMNALYFSMKDSIQNVEIEKEIINQRFEYEINKKEQEITILSSQNIILEKDKQFQSLKLYKNKIMGSAFFTGFILVLILAIVMYRGYKKKKKINRILRKQNDEKTAMLKEIHHRVKNNLQVVNSLLRLQSREFEDEHAVAMFKEAQDRVLSMALLHEKMYKSDDLKHIDVQEHISLLAEDLIKSYAVGKEISLNTNINDIDFGIQTLVPLGLIINEIITNALKHAFNDKNEGNITIKIIHLKNEKYEMIIGDDGMGLKEKKESKGIGKKLIQIFTKQLNGKLEQLEQPGTVFKLFFEKID